MGRDVGDRTVRAEFHWRAGGILAHHTTTRVGALEGDQRERADGGDERRGRGDAALNAEQGCNGE